MSQIGEKYEYIIFKIYETDNNDIECLKPVYKNSKELTLITCKKNSKKKRLIIKAIKKE
ncbi:MAG: sortase domain-bontaining protein [Candidatus Scatovivens sp.]